MPHIWAQFIGDWSSSIHARSISPNLGISVAPRPQLGDRGYLSATLCGCVFKARGVTKFGGRRQACYQSSRAGAGDCVMENCRHDCVIVTAMSHREGSTSVAAAGDGFMVTDGG